MKILIAVDGSPYTKRMLAYVAAHDEWLGAQHSYTVLHVEPTLPNNAAHMLGREVCERYYREQAAEVLDPVRKFFAQQSLPVEYLSKIGPTAATIAQTADEGRFDILMMGSHGHGALASMVVGSVTAKVMGLCKVPVLVVR